MGLTKTRPAFRVDRDTRITISGTESADRPVHRVHSSSITCPRFFAVFNIYFLSNELITCRNGEKDKKQSVIGGEYFAGRGQTQKRQRNTGMLGARHSGTV